MNQDTGATIQDIQRGICEAGTKGGIEVSRETQEQACTQAGIDPSADYSVAIVVGAMVIVILVLVVVACLFVNRTGKKPIKKSKEKA